MDIMPVAIPLPNSGVDDKKESGNDGNISFKEILDTTVQNLNSEQLKAEETVKKFLTGEIQDIHTVIVAMEEARISMQLAVEVRNKLVEAYQEISRMQI